MKKLVCLLALLCSGALAAAQSLGTGAYAFASFDNPGFDSINLGNLNTRFSIPIISRTGRGMPFSYALQYEGLVWQPSSSSGSAAWTPDPSWGFNGAVNGNTVAGYLSYRTRSRACPRQGSRNSPPATDYSNYTYHDPFGGSHVFNYSITGACPLGDGDDQVNGDGSTSDSSGYALVNGYQVSTRTGTMITPASVPNATASTSLTDSNGNSITADGAGHYTDTLGVIALTISGSNPVTLTYPVTSQADSATTASASISYSLYTVRTNFQCSAIAEYTSNSVNLISSVTLADGSSTYSFTYEPTPGTTTGEVTGRLASITLPTGGTISYSYSAGCGNGINADGSGGSLTRTTSDGTRSYTRSINGVASTTTFQDEKNNQTLFNFIASTNGETYETSRQNYQGTYSQGATPLYQKTTTYNGLSSTTEIASSITQVSSNEQYNGLAPVLTTSTYDASNNLTGTKVQDPSNNNATLLASGTSYNVNSEVTATSMQDASGNTFAYSYFGYDETTPTATSNLPNHTAASGTRGNLTSAHTSAGSVYLTTTTAYYDTGMPVSTTAANGFTTTYGYDSTQAFVTQTNLPTPSSGVSLSTTASYDQQSTMPLSTRGMNSGEATQISNYDRLLRPTGIDLPSGSQMAFSYSSNQQGVSQSRGSGTNADTEVLYDAYGRTSRSEVFNGQSTNPYYQTDLCYDASGFLQFRSVPYQGSGWSTPKHCSGNGTSYLYDALGRVTSVTNADGTAITQYQGRAVKTTDVNGVQRISQSDTLGRLSGVCEISSSTNLPNSGSPVPCGMDIAGTGFLTTYSYDLANHKTTVTQGAQTRIFQTDAAGRTTMTSEPERGITTYSYAYNSTGLQVTRTRPQANQSSATVYTTTTTQYDSLDRPVSVSYMDGGATNALTTAKSFTYDVSQLPGLGYDTGSGKGRLVGAIGGTIDLFHYDVAGNVTGYFQCLPAFCGHSGTFGHDLFFNYGYDLVGNRTADNYQNWAANGAVVTTNYAYNSANQLTSISGGQNNATGAPSIVSVSQSTPFGPSAWTYGNGLTAGNSYDTSGRVSGLGVCNNGTFQPGCNGSQVYGFTVTPHGAQVSSAFDSVLGWSSNYRYDEFNRLISNSNAIPQSYTYTYDRYGNRWGQTSSPSGPQPGFMFDASTNHIGGMSYDAAGNMLTDGLNHTYQYDAEGNLVNVNGGQTASYSYDCFNRRVEHRWAGNSSLDMPAVEEIAYNPEGQRVEIWDGSTGNMVQAQTYWRTLPVAYYKEGTIHFQHQDWRGSLRVLTSNTAAIESGSYELAFGDGAGAGGRDIDAYHFAGLDTEYETGTNHAQFREYSPGQGHWMSPDPYDGSYNFRSPQSLNRYVYTLNNPLTLTDPLGLDTMCTGATIDGVYYPGSCDNDPGPGQGGPGPVRDPPSPVDTGGGVGGGGGGGLPGIAPSNFQRMPLPANHLNCTTSTGASFPAPPGFSVSNIAANGAANGLSGAGAAVGQGGYFDFQRFQVGSVTQFFSGYTPVANVAVGAYVQGTGAPQWVASLISNTYAFFKSSNGATAQQAQFRNLGFSLAAGKGTYSCQPSVP